MEQKIIINTNVFYRGFWKKHTFHDFLNLKKIYKNIEVKKPNKIKLMIL